MLNPKGHSLATWVITFALLVAGVFFIRTPLKRTLASKITGCTDYFFWTRWGYQPAQYKGDELSHSKSVLDQQQTMWQGEMKEAMWEGETREAIAVAGVNSQAEQRAASLSVDQEGSEALLKILEPEEVLP